MSWDYIAPVDLDKIQADARKTIAQESSPEAVAARNATAYRTMAKAAAGEPLTTGEVVGSLGAATTTAATLLGATAATAAVAGGLVVVPFAVALAIVSVIGWASAGPGKCADPGWAPTGPEDPRWRRWEEIYGSAIRAPQNAFEAFANPILRLDYEYQNNCRTGVGQQALLPALVKMWNDNHQGVPTEIRGRILRGFSDTNNSPLLDVLSSGDPRGVQAITVNLGPLKPEPIAPIPFFVHTSSTTAAKVVGGVAAASAIGAGALFIYAKTQGTTVGALLAKAFTSSKRFVGLRENPLPPLLAAARPGTTKGRKVAYRVRLELDPVVETIRVDGDGTATLIRYGREIVRFTPSDWQLVKIRAGEGEVLIFADQVRATLVTR